MVAHVAPDVAPPRRIALRPLEMGFRLGIRRAARILRRRQDALGDQEADLAGGKPEAFGKFGKGHRSALTRLDLWRVLGPANK